MIRFQLVITGADSGFPKGTANSKMGSLIYYSANVSRKLHESEDNWTERDGLASQILLYRSATGLLYQNCSRFYLKESSVHTNSIRTQYILKNIN